MNLTFIFLYLTIVICYLRACTIIPICLIAYEFLDLYGFLYNLSLAANVSPYVKGLTQDAMDAFKSMIIDNHAAAGYDAYGLSVYFPGYGSSIDSDYNSSVILFAGETLWKDFITAFVSSDFFSGYTQVYPEDFSSGLPAGWTVVDGYSDGKTWEIKNSQPRPDISSPYLSSPYMIADSDAAGKYVVMDEEMISPSFDFTRYGRIYLSFNHFFRWYQKGGQGGWGRGYKCGQRRMAECKKVYGQQFGRYCVC